MNRRSGLSALAAVLCFGACGQAGSACWVAPSATSFTDSFRRLSCLEEMRHVTRADDGGITVSPAEQVWSLPGDAGFSAGRPDPTVAVSARGKGEEELSLRQEIIQPGAGARVASTCVAVRAKACALDRTRNGLVNGGAYRGAGRGFPYLGRAAVAGWDSREGRPECYAAGPAGQLGGVSSFDGMPILEGSTGPLVPGAEYSVSFVMSAVHDATPAPYVEFSVLEPGGPGMCASVTVAESDVEASSASTEFGGMTKFSLGFTAPPENGAGMGFRAASRTASEKHCTFLGPVYLTAQRGRYVSPVFDSLSDDTAWQRIEWEADQSSAAADPSCACPNPGSALTPVVVGYGVSDSGDPAVNRFVPAPHADKGVHAIPAPDRGRYLRLGAEFYGREAAAEVDPSLAPTVPHRRFSGHRPVLKNLKVRYFARTAMAVSGLICPPAVLRWGALEFGADTPAGSTAVVDVLSADGELLAAGVASGAGIGGAVDAFRHPAIRLRVKLTSSPSEPGKRAALRYWRVRWENSTERMTLNRASIDPRRGGVVRGLVAVELGGRVNVKVHDSSREFIAEVFDGRVGARAVAFEWDGRDAEGKHVKPGTYLITAETPKGAGTRKVRVTR